MHTSKFSVPPDLRLSAKTCKGKKQAFIFPVKIETGDTKWWTTVYIATFWEGKGLRACANEPRLGLFSRRSEIWEKIQGNNKVWLDIADEIERFGIALAAKAGCLFRDITVTFQKGYMINGSRIREIDDCNFRIQID